MLGILFEEISFQDCRVTRLPGHYQWLFPQTFYTSDKRGEVHGQSGKTRDGEIRGVILKSESVKHHFIGMLLRNIGKALSASALTYHYETPRGRILIYGDHPEKIADTVSRIFGLVDVSICTVQHRLEDICTRSDLSCIRKSA